MLMPRFLAQSPQISLILFDMKALIGLFYIVLELRYVGCGETKAFCAQNVDGFERDLEVGGNQLLSMCRHRPLWGVVLLR